MSRLEELTARKKKAEAEVASSSRALSDKGTKKQLEAQVSEASDPGPSVSSVGEDTKEDLGSAIVPYKREGKEMSVEEKLDLYRAGKVADGCFTSNELGKFKGKFDYARKNSSKLQEAYQKMCTRNDGTQDRKTARYMMLAWLKSPEDPENVIKLSLIHI